MCNLHVHFNKIIFQSGVKYIDFKHAAAVLTLSAQDIMTCAWTFLSPAIAFHCEAFLTVSKLHYEETANALLFLTALCQAMLLWESTMDFLCYLVALPQFTKPNHTDLLRDNLHPMREKITRILLSTLSKFNVLCSRAFTCVYLNNLLFYYFKCTKMFVVGAQACEVITPFISLL